MWLESGSFESYMSDKSSQRMAVSNVTKYNHTLIDARTLNVTIIAYDTPVRKLADSEYWLPQLAAKGKVRHSLRVSIRRREGENGHWLTPVILIATHCRQQL